MPDSIRNKKIVVACNRTIELLSSHRIVRKEIDATRFYLSKTQKSAVIKILVLVAFIVVIFKFPSLWLIIPLLIISCFMICLLILEIKDLIRLPKILKDKAAIIHNGIAQIREINIDRYLRDGKTIV